MDIEIHPFEPYLPPNAKILIMGTFPPPPKRWTMEFYYPNRINDFWFMMGLIFFGNKDALYDREKKQFKLAEIKRLLNDKGIALNDTGWKIRRLKGNASDKFLEIVEPVNLQALLAKMPGCRTLATTGEKAANTLAIITGTTAPAMGKMITGPDNIEIWRMPSTSRAYPLPIDRKAEYYARMFRHCGILDPIS